MKTVLPFDHSKHLNLLSFLFVSNLGLNIEMAEFDCGSLKTGMLSASATFSFAHLLPSFSPVYVV